MQDRLLGEGFQDEEAIHMALVEKNDLLPFIKDKKDILLKGKKYNEKIEYYFEVGND